MARKNGPIHRTSEDLKAVSDYYKLHTEAVDDLASANKENTPRYSESELKKYRSKHRLNLPMWVKAVFIKAWFAGAVCFFIFWGLGNYIADALDMLLVFGVVLGIIGDLLVNSILRFIAEVEGDTDKWMMFPKKRYSSFVFNLFYGCWLLFCVYTLYQAINGAVIALFGPRETVPLGVEPVLFGLFYAGFDLLFVGMKAMFFRIIRDAGSNH